jgi:hypothetical protein
MTQAVIGTTKEQSRFIEIQNPLGLETGDDGSS